MKYFILFLGLILTAFCFTSCGGDDANVEIDNTAAIESYLTNNNLTAQVTDSGLYYIIEKEGNGEFPIATSTVTVHYRGTLTDGSQFDSSYSRGMPSSFSLQSVIAGWTEGIPLFSKGGAGQLIIPSKLGYGSQARSGIPANSVLIFDIELFDF